MRLSASLLSILAACTASEATPCERAAEHVNACFGVELDQCDDRLASDLLSMSCEQIAMNASPDTKADGSVFCPAFLWWLCGTQEPEVSETSCPGAPDASEYEYLSAAERLDYHWQWVQCTEYGQNGVGERPTELWDRAVDQFQALRAAFGLGEVFDVTTDEREDRSKLFHPYGNVAVAEIVAADPDESCHVPYTGLFGQENFDAHVNAEGERTLPVLARLSWGAAPGTPGFYYIPGVALKFFVDGGDSVNVHLISDLNGDPSEPNFFGQSISNVLPRGDGVFGFVANQLCMFADNPNHLRLDHTARVMSDGTEVPIATALAPHQLVFEPTDAIYAFYQEHGESDDPGPGGKDGYRDMRLTVGEIPAGTVLYEIYAYGDPYACREHLGSLRTTTPLVSSQWGDYRLFFQHSREAQNPRNIPRNLGCGF